VKVHLVDGTYELFRSFYGAPSSTSPTGMEVGATRGILATFLRLVKDDGATHVGIAFDHIIESFRNDLYPGYKTGAGIDPLLWAQAPLAERAATALGMVMWPMVEFEADDAIAAAAAKYRDDNRVEQIVIATPDKDMLQCVRGDHVVEWDRRRQIVINEAGVSAKLGVPPASVPDYLALVGDSADGFPGLKGWGAKSAAVVLARYGRLEDIPQSVADWDVRVTGAARLNQRLRADYAEALLYRTLATLREDVPLTETIEDLEWKGADRGLLTTLCEEIGAPQFLDLVPRWR
jgi:5'-3' exonuclease